MLASRAGPFTIILRSNRRFDTSDRHNLHADERAGPIKLYFGKAYDDFLQELVLRTRLLLIGSPICLAPGQRIFQGSKVLGWQRISEATEDSQGLVQL